MGQPVSRWRMPIMKCPFVNLFDFCKGHFKFVKIFDKHGTVVQTPAASPRSGVGRR